MSVTLIDLDAYVRRENLARRLKGYGLLVGDYDRILADQGGHCALCPATAGVSRTGGTLLVDHCHLCEHIGRMGAARGRESVRGLLCASCNAGGRYDDIGYLRDRIAYLEKHVCPGPAA